MIASKGPIDRLFGPLELWSSSFSSKTISPKTLAMNDAIDELREVKPHTQLLSLPTLPLPPSLPLLSSLSGGGGVAHSAAPVPHLARPPQACRDLRSAASGKEGSGGFFGFGGPKACCAALRHHRRRRCAHRSHRRQPLLPPALAARPFRDMSWTHPSPQAMDDGKRRKIAQDAYAKGKDAINKYIELGNDGLGLNFTPIDQMD